MSARRVGTRRGRSPVFAAILPLLLAASLHGTATAQTGDTRFSDVVQDAYLDETARRLVLGAKAARDTSRLTIDAYTTVIRERIGIEAPAFRRDRAWSNGERAVRIRWSRTEPNIVHVLGARLQRPGRAPGEPAFFPGLRVERFAADPLWDPFVFGIAPFVGLEDADANLRSPLHSDSEQFYQFRSGDTISVQVGPDRIFQVVTVEAIPRYPSARLVSAIMWIDPDSFGLGRVAYRLAKKIDRELSWQVRRDGEWGLALSVNAGTDDSTPASDSLGQSPGLFGRLLNGVVNNSMPRMEMDISTVVADYRLWEMRYWLPRSVKWTAYIGASDGITATGFVPPAIPLTIDWTIEIEDVRERRAEATTGTPATAMDAFRLWRAEGDSIGGELESEDPGEAVTITPANRQALATSDLLPLTVWEADQEAEQAALTEVASMLSAIGTGEGGNQSDRTSPWIFDPPGKTLRLLRYNPVERMSVGTRLRRDFAWGTAVLTSRIGTARVDLPDIDLTLQRDHPRRRILFSVYRALETGDLRGSDTGSLDFYVTGDATDFHWSHGAAIRLLPPIGDRNWISLRLFAEQHADIGSDTTRNRVGTSLEWRPWWGGVDVRSTGGGVNVRVQGTAGDNPHTKAVAEAGVVVPLPGRMSLGLQTGIGRVWGDPAHQDLWRIGGSGEWLRGHDDAVKASRIHMARMDVQWPVHLARLSLFGDWASAGGDDLFAVGAGLVFMDGAVRLDVARGLARSGGGPPGAVLRLHLLGDMFF